MKDETENFDQVEAFKETPAPPVLPSDMSAEEKYLTLIITAIRKCLEYKPRFGKGRKQGLTLDEFKALYGADPFYHWFGVDSPLMYAAHRAAGGMTSVYRQIGIGCQWMFNAILQDTLKLKPQQTVWGYTVTTDAGRQRKLSLDARIVLQDVQDRKARCRLQKWLDQVAAEIGLPAETLKNIKGVVFEIRQGYKSKDSKRQNADIANAAKAYANLYVPTLLLFSTQIDRDVAERYRENLWVLLTGTVEGHPTSSTYSFCRDIIGFDLAEFFTRHSSCLRAEIDCILKALLSV